MRSSVSKFIGIRRVSTASIDSVNSLVFRWTRFVPSCMHQAVNFRKEFVFLRVKFRKEELNRKLYSLLIIALVTNAVWSFHIHGNQLFLSIS